MLEKLKDSKARGGENEIIDPFLTLAGYEAIMKISVMVRIEGSRLLIMSHKTTLYNKCKDHLCYTDMWE